jgi:hypothetical protein
VKSPNRPRHINREHVRLVELQYIVGMLRQQEQRSNQQSGQRHHGDNNPPPSPPPSYRIPQPPSPPHHHYISPPPQLGTIDPKSPLAIYLQLAPWPPQYRAVTPPKYHRNANPRKFLVSYEAVIASAGGDEVTLAKSLIISLEEMATNWYFILPLGCIYSLLQLQEKFLLNFQGFQAELDSEEDFLSCTQRERETLPNFYRRFL